jgi:hypothetical protein
MNTIILVVATLIVLGIIFDKVSLFLSRAFNRQNYMLYPCYSWEEINEALKQQKMCSQKLMKYFKKTDEIYNRIHENLVKKNVQSVERKDLDSHYLNLEKQVWLYRMGSDLIHKRFRFMVKANCDFTYGRKAEDEIFKEYRQSEFDGLRIDDDNQIVLMGALSGVFEKDWKKFLEENIDIYSKEMWKRKNEIGKKQYNEINGSKS